jgi:hypothetical protein
MAFERTRQLLNTIAQLDETKIINAILNDKDFQEFIIRLNTKGEPTSQLFEEGIDSLSISLGNYAATTIEGTSSFEGKKDKGQRFDHITLEDTGEFYKSFKIEVSNGGFKMTANPVKDNSNLFDDFGENIVGLTKENLQIVIDAIREKIILSIREQIKMVA